MKDCPCCNSPSTSNSIEEIVKNAYDSLWASQKRRNESSDCCSDSEPHVTLLKKLSLRNGIRVLDVGSGNGDTVLKIAEKIKPDGKAVGVDFSPEGIALARKEARKRNLQNVAEFHLAKAQKLPFPDNYFDAVISECVVCLIQDKQEALNEKVRVLKPNGKVVMHDVISNIPMPKTMTNDQKMYNGCIGGAVSTEEYINIMEKAGLINIETVDFTKESGKTLNRAIIEYALELKDEQDFQEIVNFVRKGGISYVLFSGIKTKQQ